MAQDRPDLRVVVQEDGDAYVYHGRLAPLGHGFNIYRSDDGGEFVQLNETPIRGAASGRDLDQFLGERYDEVARRVEAGNPQTTFLRLRTDRELNLILTFVYPSVAEALGRLYVDEDAPEGEQATYRIEFVDDLGRPTGEELQETVTLDPQRPDPPAELRAEHSGTLVTLYWTYPTPPPGVDDGVIRFNVYREDGPDITRVNEELVLRTNDGSEYFHRFDVPAAGESYGFFVEAVDVTGQAGPPSEPLVYEVLDNVPPSAPFGVETVTTTVGDVEVTWQTSLEQDVEGYHVYRARRSQGDYTPLTDEPVDVLETFYVDSTTVPGTQYHYRVTAVDASGNESERSNPASALVEDDLAPGAPASVEAAFQEDGTVRLTWEAASGAADLNTYVILRKREGLGTPAVTQLNNDRVTGDSFVDRGIAEEGFAEGAYYRYGVAAADSSANFSDTTFVVLQIPDLTPPEPPTMLRATVEDGVRVNLSWNASPSQDVVAYGVRREPSEVDSSLVRVPQSVCFARDEQVEPGRQYFYSVVAVDSFGNESARSPVDTLLMRDGSPPRRVRNVQAVFSGDDVMLRWEPVDVPDLAGYRVERADIPTGVYEPVSAGLLDETTWTDPNGTAGTWYRVRAIDSSQNESPPSTRAQAVAGSQ